MDSDGKGRSKVNALIIKYIVAKATPEPTGDVHVVLFPSHQVLAVVCMHSTLSLSIEHKNCCTTIKTYGHQSYFPVTWYIQYRGSEKQLLTPAHYHMVLVSMYNTTCCIM